jgi:Mrp family chromosome partitioning ATPase
LSRDFEVLQRLQQDLLGMHGANAGTTQQLKPTAFRDSPIVCGRRPAQSLTELARRESAATAQRLFLLGPSEFPDSVIFASVDENSNSFQIASCVGDMLCSLTARSVCVIDANVRGKRSYGNLGITDAPGFSDILADGKSLLEVPHRLAENLWIVTAGRRESDADSLISSRHAERAIAEAQAQFDYVLINTAPLSLANDGAFLGRFTNGAVLIVESNSTSRESADRAKQAFVNAQVRLLGAILNNGTTPIPQALYSRLY